MKMMLVTEELARRHYSALREKPFFPRLVDFMTSSPIVAMVVEDENAVELVRNTMGATDPAQAAPGTIRGDLATSIGQNLIHGSDSAESAQKEIDLFFDPSEILSYDREVDRWITES